MALDGLSGRVCGRQHLLRWVWNLEDTRTPISSVTLDRLGSLPEAAFLFCKGRGRNHTRQQGQ